MSDTSAAILNRPIPQVRALTITTIATGASRSHRSRVRMRTKPTTLRSNTG